MRVGVWGAGNLGTALVRRLTTTAWTSEVHWTNRSRDKLQAVTWDVEHGLAFAPTCHTLQVHEQPDAPDSDFLAQVDALVVTAGVKVPPGETRAGVYPENRSFYRETILPALVGFPGVVLVVTNPVDLMARLVHVESGLAAERVLGLGTVVETARLRWSLSQHLWPRRQPRDIQAFAVGTHDEHFVPMHVHRTLAPQLDEGDFGDCCEVARREVVKGAARIKQGGQATLHPIVEGVVQILEAVALDRRVLLTVSVLDPDDGDSLFWSAPCSIGATGRVERHAHLLRDAEEALAHGREALRRQLAAAS